MTKILFFIIFLVMKKHIAISLIYRFAEKHRLRTDVYADKGYKFISNEQGKSIIGFTDAGFWDFSRELSLFKKGNQIEPTNGLTYWCCRNNIHTWGEVSRYEFEEYLEREFAKTNKFFYFMLDNYRQMVKEYKEKQAQYKMKIMLDDFNEAK